MSKKLEFDAATAKLKSTKRPLRFAKDAVGLTREQVQKQAPPLPQVRAPRFSTEEAWAAAEFNFQSLTALESALQGEVGQLT